jgi:ADP-heptose:LPS heptosyltransferase
MNQEPGLDALPIAVRFSSLGDVVLTTGTIAYWSRLFDTKFVVLTKQAFAPVFKGHSGVAQVLSVADNDLGPKAWLRFCLGLKRSYPKSQLFDLHSSLRTMLLDCLWPNQVHRVPKFTLSRNLLQYRLASRRILSALDQTNVPQRYALAFCASSPAQDLLRPRIELSATELGQAAKLVGDPVSKPTIALHPYATHQNKAWPAEYWLELTCLLEQAGLDWRIIGRSTRALLPDDPRDLTNQTDLRASCGVIAQCSALVSGDSGPLHLGTAVGTPVIGLFGPTSRHWGFYPSGLRDQVLEVSLACRPCSLHGQKRCPHGQRCLREIAPELVLRRLKDTLEA